jgi:hypothetical protein
MRYFQDIHSPIRVNLVAEYTNTDTKECESDTIIDENKIQTIRRLCELKKHCIQESKTIQNTVNQCLACH